MFLFYCKSFSDYCCSFFLQGHFNALGTPCIYLSLKGSVGECKEHNKREQLFSYFFQGSHRYLKYSFYMQPILGDPGAGVRGNKSGKATKRRRFTSQAEKAFSA